MTYHPIRNKKDIPMDDGPVIVVFRGDGGSEYYLASKQFMRDKMSSRRRSDRMIAYADVPEYKEA